MEPGPGAGAVAGASIPVAGGGWPRARRVSPGRPPPPKRSAAAGVQCAGARSNTAVPAAPGRPREWFGDLKTRAEKC